MLLRSGLFVDVVVEAATIGAAVWVTTTGVIFLFGILGLLPLMMGVCGLVDDFQRRRKGSLNADVQLPKLDYLDS